MSWVWWMIALPAAAAFGDDWPLRQGHGLFASLSSWSLQVCSDIGRASSHVADREETVNWMQMRRWLWSQVSATDSGLLTTKDMRRIGLVSVQALTTYRHGPANEEACWLGVLALQFWGLLMQFPQIHPHEFEVDWRLFASADWTLVLLSEFPIFGLLHQAQQAIQSCEMFAVGTTRLPGGHRTCPLPRCDLQDDAEGLGLEEVQRAQLFFDMLVNSALAGEAVFMVTVPRVPRCPLGQAAQELAFAVVDAVRYGAGAWRQISRTVMSAKSRMMKWLQGDLSQAPQRRDELGNISTADPLSEVLASRWNLLGLLHALQVVLRRSVDSHPHIQLPWLVAEGPRGLDLLADTSSLRGSFARYLEGIKNLTPPAAWLERGVASSVSADDGGVVRVALVDPVGLVAGTGEDELSSHRYSPSVPSRKEGRSTAPCGLLELRGQVHNRFSSS
eukprot:s640_g8.t1